MAGYLRRGKARGRRSREQESSRALCDGPRRCLPKTQGQCCSGHSGAAEETKPRKVAIRRVLQAPEGEACRARVRRCGKEERKKKKEKNFPAISKVFRGFSEPPRQASAG